MNEEAKKPVVEAPQIVTPTQARDLDKAAKLYAEGKKKRAEAEALIVTVLGNEPTLPQVQHAKAYFVQALKKTSIKLNSSIITEVDKLFKAVMEFNQIPYPKAQTQSAQKARASREANAKKEAERLRKKGLIDKSMAELKKLKKVAFTKASQAEGAEEQLAETEIADIDSAIKIAKGKQKASDKEAVKVVKTDLRAYITEENRLERLEKMREVVKTIATS
tara:strand:+ start:450 stop:1109 length:660 start_codon:yes stop_codon:yes gene_type:complete